MPEVTFLNRENKEEIEATRTLLLQSYAQYETILGKTGDYDDYIESIRHSLSNEEIEQVIIVKEQNEVLGSLQVFLNAQKAYQIDNFHVEQPFIRLLAVSPTARNKGIAKALLNTAIDYLQEKGYKEVDLHTSAYMEAAVRLYERYGFERFEAYDFHKPNRTVTCYRYQINR